MATIEKSISINAPVNEVSSYLDEPINLPDIWPSLIETNNIQRLPNGGTKFGWVYKMGGLRFKGSSEAIDYRPKEYGIFRNSSGIASRMT